MAAQVEFFTELSPSDAEDHVQDEQEYQELEFKALAQRSRFLASPTRGVRLSREDLKVWQWRYPTVYCQPLRADLVGRRPSGQVAYFWTTLEWPIPEEVRELIRIARTAQRFERLEIWTPELKRAPATGLSPILVGAIGSETYLLARWAEALEPFEDIKARMQCSRGWLASRVRQTYIRGEFIPVPLAAWGCGTIGGLVTGWALSSSLLLVGSALCGFLFAFEAVITLPAMRRWACGYAGWVCREN